MVTQDYHIHPVGRGHAKALATMNIMPMLKTLPVATHVAALPTPKLSMTAPSIGGLQKLYKGR